jgi:hypothetical protein
MLQWPGNPERYSGKMCVQPGEMAEVILDLPGSIMGSEYEHYLYFCYSRIGGILTREAKAQSS